MMLNRWQSFVVGRPISVRPVHYLMTSLVMFCLNSKMCLITATVIASCDSSYKYW